MADRKRIALFVCNDLIALILANKLVPLLIKQGWEPVIYNTEERKNRKTIYPSPPDVGFFVAGIVSNPLLPYLDSNPPHKAIYHSYKNLAALHGIEYATVSDVNDDAQLRRIEEDAAITGGLSLRFLQVFEQRVINAFRAKGFLWNLHGGLLPDYKGLLIPYHAILNGEKDYGWTLHETAHGIDTGDIIAQDSMKLDPRQPVFDMYVEMVDKGVGMIMTAIENHKSYKHYPQHGGGDYYSFPSPATLAAARAADIRYIESPAKHADFITGAFGGGGAHSAGLIASLHLAIDAFQAEMEERDNQRLPTAAKL